MIWYIIGELLGKIFVNICTQMSCYDILIYDLYFIPYKQVLINKNHFLAYFFRLTASLRTFSIPLLIRTKQYRHDNGLSSKRSLYNYNAINKITIRDTEKTPKLLILKHWFVFVIIIFFSISQPIQMYIIC